MKTINPNGPSNSKIFILTDLPEVGDATKGKIFTSKQGWLFNKMLGDINERMGHMYVSSCVSTLEIPDKSVVKSNIKLTKFIGEHSRSVPEISNEIAHVKPNVIIAVGEWPLQILTGNSGIKQFQGSVLSLTTDYNQPNIKVVPVQHPRDIFKVYSAYYYTPVYLRRALEFKDDPHPFKETIHIEIATNFSTLTNYAKNNKTSPFIVSDIETYYNLISCIGISLSSDSALVIPLLEDLITPVELSEMLKYLQKLYNYFPYVNQNAVFDQIRLERFGFRLKEVLGDTMLNMSLLYPELPKNLGFQNSLFTRIPYFKDEGKGYTPGKQLYLYCGKDCVSTYQIYEKQVSEMKEVGVYDFCKNHMMKFYPVYRDMQCRGIQVDTRVRDELKEKYEVLMLTYTGDIKETLGRSINPLSPKQCNELLYEELGLPVQKKRRATGEYTETADEDAIEFLILNHVDDPQVKDLLYKIIYTRKIKKIQSYLEIKLHPGDIFHTGINLAGTETGRTSTSKSGDRWYYYDEKSGISYEELGFALQTIPKHGFELSDGTRLGSDLRRIFVPRDGYVFAEGDQAKAEAVIVTILAQDWDLYHKFYDINLHKVTAVDVFNLKEINEVTVDQYNIGKRVRHAANYDMKEGTLAQQAMISVTAARTVLNEFHKKNWKIRGNFHRSVKDFATRNMWLNTPYGRRRDFFVNPKDNNWIREAYAYIPQSTVADKTKIGMYATREILEDRKIDFYYLGESHDSVLAEVRKGQEHEYLSTLKENMEKPIDMRKCCIPRDIDAVIKFECGMSEISWKDIKEVEV